MLRNPRAEETELNRTARHSHPLAVERGIVLLDDIPIVRRNVEVVFLRSHGQRREQHVRRALLREGDVAHEVDFTVFEHLNELGPTALDVVVGPPGIGGDSLLVFVSVSRTAPELVNGIERRFEPAHAHGLIGILGVCESRKHEGRRQDETKRDCEKPSVSEECLQIRHAQPSARVSHSRNYSQ